MKTLFIVAFFACMSFIGNAQYCNCARPDSTVDIIPDTVEVGSYFKFNIWCDWNSSHSGGSSDIYDTFNVYCVSFYSSLDSAILKIPVMSAYHNSTSYVETFTARMPKLDDSIYTHIYIAVVDNNKTYGQGCFSEIFIAKNKGITGIQSVSMTNKQIICIRYYTMLGQLYGEFPIKQNNLPSIPLIEEIIYTDGSYSSRNLVHL